MEQVYVTGYHHGREWVEVRHVVGDNLKFKDGLPIHERALKQLMGLSEKDQKRMPPELHCGPFWIGNVQVYILSAKFAQSYRPGSRFAHRVIAHCPHCGKEIPAGRFGQHMKRHKAAAEKLLAAVSK